MKMGNKRLVKKELPRTPYSGIALLNIPEWDTGESVHICVQESEHEPNELSRCSLIINSSRGRTVLYMFLDDKVSRSNALFKLSELKRMIINLELILKNEFKERGLNYEEC